MITKPGIYDLAPADYHALPHLSRSTAHTLLTKSPAHAKAGMSDEPNGAMRLGTVWHKIVLGKGDEYAISPFDEYRTNEAKAWRDEQIEAGLVPIKRKEFDIAQEMAERLHEQLGHPWVDINGHLIGDPLAEPGTSEATLIWQDHGVECRAMVDRLPEDHQALFDIKSTEDASDQAFRRACERHGYGLQAHFYTRGLAALTGREAQQIQFFFIVMETAPPHLINIHEVSGEYLHMAEEKIDKALAVWKRSMASGQWHGYGPHVNVIDPPGWAIKEWEFQRAIDAMEDAA